MAIITFGCLLVTELFTRFYFHDNAYYQQHGWPKVAGFLVAAVLVWSLSRRNRDDIYVGVEDLRRESVLRERDTLFYIPARYWPAVLCVLGALFYFVRG